jgi:virginiamycin B lyase
VRLLQVGVAAIVTMMLALASPQNPAAEPITEFTIPTGNSGPQGITVGADGALWFTENSANKLGRITTTGTITETATIPTVGSQPYDITLGADGNLWFTEHSGNKIGRYDGTFTEFATPNE